MRPLEGRDNAAGIRGTIAKLSQLNDDGTPAAPPPKVEAHALSADAGAHTSGLLLGSGAHCKCAERWAAKPNPDLIGPTSYGGPGG